MTGSTPPWKRRFSKRGADQGPSDGPYRARDDERGPTLPGTASLEPAADRADHPVPEPAPAPAARRRAAVLRDRATEGVRKGGDRARSALAHLADHVIDIAPRVPVRDLAALRRQFPGLGPEELADRLVAGATRATATVGAGVGAAAMLPVPPAMPTELAAEVTGVAAIELKLIAELHEVYGVRPPGGLGRRSTAYLNSWSDERGIDVTEPSTFGTALNGHMKRQLRQQIMKRMVRNLPNLMPFMVGAAVGAVMNRRDTRKLAERIRADLRRIQVPWEALPELPALEAPEDALELETGEDGR
ncbi:hypothetical protein AB0E75_22615 [Streptomyces griseoviridis]|uniref:EcsC family protein n=3 Tax=Streptomyces TaxID=1883 RepID=A0ABT9LLX6_STRGD|nr:MULTISPECIES: hypothetical protein [Streptomyces]MDP9684551.1 hypothetical protein [Streptomyces griseoviridis]GGS51814.1 hypothetical protein GCM10010238_46690 [Streptomyces niveoruber]GGT06378.1 hypothetical protein GCM10010240_44770 [Streptomyces griseoviridis]GGU52465.1 hypothetical protein GCM10010259_49730 [Streptomyces daghestanicus]GHI30486.1 hypothetical protein Sdagh_22160 [Streptomyces daghestanicus]